MGLEKGLRITRRSDFDKAFQRGSRFSDSTLVIVAVPNGLDHPRLGISVGRKYGNSVRRNRFKRLVREAFRQSMEGVTAGLDLVVMPRGGIQEGREEGMNSLHDLAGSLEKLVKKAVRKYEDEMGGDITG